MRMNASGKMLMISLSIVLWAGSPIFATSKKTESGDKPDTAQAENVSNTKETLLFDWPEKDQWVADYHHVQGASDVQLYFPKGQSSAGWEEMTSVEIVYGKTKVNVPGMARMTYLGTKRGSPNATWEILEKGATENGYPFITYEIVCPDFLSKEPPQVQLWKIIVGKTALFTLQYSYKGEEMPEKRKEQILGMLHKSDIKAEEI